MPRRRKTSLTKLSSEAKRKRLARNNETISENEARLQSNRERASEIRNSENDEAREWRLCDMRARMSQIRANETVELHDERLSAMRSRMSQIVANETEETRNERLSDMRARMSEIRANETVELHDERLSAMRSRMSQIVANETAEMRNERLSAMRSRMSQSVANETEEMHDERLSTMRSRIFQVRANENLERRVERLNSNRERIATARVSNSSQQLESYPILPTININLNQAAFQYNPSINYQNHKKLVIGKMDQVCNKCKALKFKGETPGMCCSNGKIRLDDLNMSLDTPLYTLLQGYSEESKQFLKNIRKYNACFQMTSFGTTAQIQEPGFMPVFKIQGQVYHKYGSLLPPSDEIPTFLQVYFMGDDNLEIDRRCQIIPDVDRNIVSRLQSFLHDNNNIIQMFTTALEQMPTEEYKVIVRADKTPSSEHARRYNAPTVDEVAIVMVGNNCERPRDIVLKKRDGNLQKISETHRFYDALQYPLMFCRGEDGYHFEIKQVNPGTNEITNKKVSAMDFYSYRIMVRHEQFNHILRYGQLFNQFLVDMYAKIESERLLYIRLNQNKLRADEYVHLRDAIANDGNIAEMGKLVILPATFTGSPRHMHEYAQDAFVYVRAYGRPNLFITFTCNPLWLEIQNELFDGQTAIDRHDIVARVFKQKLNKFIQVITKEKIFGDVIAWVYSVEWQKRGLPHSHILIWCSTPIRSNQIDEVISAEIPDPTIDPVLHEIVCKHMIHGPCGEFNRNSPCMVNGKCSKGFPKEYIEETQTGERGYPQYRRRKPDNGGQSISKRIKVNNRFLTVQVDNRWVVPYSPILLRMFNAHINTEISISIKAIKYLLKYIHKGGDQAIISFARSNNNTATTSTALRNVAPSTNIATTTSTAAIANVGANITTTVDEISQFQLGRYINSNEAVWRILGFSIHDRHPTVVHLHVHLKDEQRVFFTEGNVRNRVVSPQNTTLTAFFKLCEQDEFARTLLYSEVPKYYIWNNSRKIFSRRKQGPLVEGQNNIHSSEALGRVYNVHPNNAECYYLRLLLHTIRGPTSFEALRTIDGVVCETYREACYKLGLLENDQHWDHTLSEGSITSTPYQIRFLFAIILSNCSPSNPKELWEKHRESMSEDIAFQAQRRNSNVELNMTEVYNSTLIILEDLCLIMCGKPINQLGLDRPIRNENNTLNQDIIRETSYNVDQLSRYVSDNEPLLLDDQRKVYSTILESIQNNVDGIYFVDAPGGTGKTFVINLLLSTVRSNGQIALALASSGIASTLLEGGRTAHSALKLPLHIEREDTPVCDISRGSAKAEVLRTCSLIVWDECTMAHRKSLEALDRTMKDIKNNNRLMGGVVVLLAGDFRQTLPVIRNSTPADELNACIKNSYLWSRIKVMKLSTNMRVHNLGDTDSLIFAQQLLRIGDGKVPVEPTTKLITFPPNFCQLVTSLEELQIKVFPNLGANYKNHNWLCERAILAPTNVIVDSINIQIQNQIPGTVTSYKSVDTTMNNDDSANYPVEFLNSLVQTGMPPHNLCLKIGVPIILLRNLKPPKLCNGTRLCVKKLMTYLIEATILTGCGKGENVLIPRIPIISTELPFDFKRLQFPVKVAFAMTINKAQGQSLKVTGINLESPCFSHGQLYVACSRVGSPKNLYVYAPEGKTRNVVYPKALE